MKLFIPSIKDQLRLTEDWVFPCFEVYMNWDFINRMRPEVKLKQDRWGNDSQSVVITIPKGTVLKVERIYIRAGKKDWDSVTFSMVIPGPVGKRGQPTKGKSSRFFAKLVDVNELHCELVE